MASDAAVPAAAAVASAVADQGRPATLAGPNQSCGMCAGRTTALTATGNGCRCPRRTRCCLAFCADQMRRTCRLRLPLWSVVLSGSVTEGDAAPDPSVAVGLRMGKQLCCRPKALGPLLPWW